MEIVAVNYKEVVLAEYDKRRISAKEVPDIPTMTFKMLH